MLKMFKRIGKLIQGRYSRAPTAYSLNSKGSVALVAELLYVAARQHVTLGSIVGWIQIMHMFRTIRTASVGSARRATLKSERDDASSLR